MKDVSLQYGKALVAYDRVLKDTAERRGPDAQAAIDAAYGDVR